MPRCRAYALMEADPAWVQAHEEYLHTVAAAERAVRRYLDVYRVLL